MRFVLKIKLEGLDNPEVWRTIAVPINYNFNQLHNLIQAVMSWQNKHLYAFNESLRSKYFSIESPHNSECTINAEKISVSSILLAYLNQFKMPGEKKDLLYYTYDFGDNWVHTIEVLDLDRDGSLAELLDGEGACPEEDSGGIHSYKMLIDFSNGSLPKKNFKDVFGYNPKKIDPTLFDIEKAKKAMKSAGNLKLK
jgi:hypothetical protein